MKIKEKSCRIQKLLREQILERSKNNISAAYFSKQSVHS